MMELIQTCNEILENLLVNVNSENLVQDAETIASSLTRGIIPGYLNFQLPDTNNLIFCIIQGTLWCGVDDIAEDFDHLGQNWTLDKCCRAHDHCPTKVSFYYKVI